MAMEWIGENPKRITDSLSRTHTAVLSGFSNLPYLPLNHLAIVPPRAFWPAPNWCADHYANAPHWCAWLVSAY